MSWFTDDERAPAALARRSARLGAVLIGMVLAGALTWFTRAADLRARGVSSVVLLAFGIVQIVLLGTRGQTIGKLMLGIAIVDRIDETPPGYVRAALIRQLPQFILSALAPAFGVSYLLLDSLPILTARRRCIHDYLAGTVVIDVSGGNSR